MQIIGQQFRGRRKQYCRNIVQLLSFSRQLGFFHGMGGNQIERDHITNQSGDECDK